MKADAGVVAHTSVHRQVGLRRLHITLLQRQLLASPVVCCVNRTLEWERCGCGGACIRRASCTCGTCHNLDCCAMELLNLPLQGCIGVGHKTVKVLAPRGLRLGI